LTAIIVAKKDSKLEKLRDLKHKVIAMPPMTSAVSRLSRAALLEIGYDFPTDVKMLHFRTHPAGLQAVLIGKAKACVTNAVPLRVFQSKTGIMFKVLAETDKIPHVLFAVHKRVPAHDRDLIRRSIIELKNTPEGRLLLRQSGMLKGFVAAIDGDYDIVRSMSRALGGK
jgi:phosphonate transport system substrate-binding protein